MILNTDGYYDRLLACIDLMVEEKMMRPIHKEMFVVVNEPEDVLPAIQNAPDWDPSTRRLASILGGDMMEGILRVTSSMSASWVSWVMLVLLVLLAFNRFFITDLLVVFRGMFTIN